MLERVDRVLVVGGDEHDVTRVTNHARRLDAGHARHPNVEKRKIRMMVVDGCDRFFAVLRFRHNLQVRPDFGETRAQLLTH